MPRLSISVMLVVGVSLTSCGARQPLKPLPGMTTAPKAATAAVPETPAEMMTPSTQAKPERQVELLTRSTERADDPFDRPPGPDNGQ